MNVDRMLRELLELWPAWESLTDFLSRSGPGDADPHAIYEAACDVDHDRLVALLYAHHVGDTMADAEQVLDELLDMAREGRRPRNGREIGLSA
jgi:hypothetical protein